MSGLRFAPHSFCRSLFELMNSSIRAKIHSSHLSGQCLSQWSFQSWVRFHHLSFSRSAFVSVNLLITTKFCYSGNLSVMSKIGSSFFQQISVWVNESINLLLVTKIHSFAFSSVCVSQYFGQYSLTSHSAGQCLSQWIFFGHNRDSLLSVWITVILHALNELVLFLNTDMPTHGMIMIDAVFKSHMLFIFYIKRRKIGANLASEWIKHRIWMNHLTEQTQMILKRLQEKKKVWTCYKSVMDL